MKRKFIASYFLIVFVGMTILPFVLPLSGEQYSAFLIDFNDEEPTPKSIEELAKQHKLLSNNVVSSIDIEIVFTDKIEYYNHQYDVLYVPPIHLPPPDLV